MRIGKDFRCEGGKRKKSNALFRRPQRLGVFGFPRFSLRGFELAQGFLKVGRERRLQANSPLCGRVVKGEFPSVQYLPLGLEANFGSQSLSFAVAVESVTEQGKANVLKMDADLVGAAGAKVGFNERSVGEMLDHSELSMRRASALFGCDHAFAVRWMPGNFRLDCAFQRRHSAAGNGLVDFLDGAVGELMAQVFVRRVGFCRDYAAAGALIQPVDNAPPSRSSDIAQLAPAVMKQSVDESAREPAGCRMNAEAGRFVENEKMLVFKENFQRHGFRQDLAVFGRGQANANKVARFGLVSRLDAVFADGDAAFVNEPG